MLLLIPIYLKSNKKQTKTKSETTTQPDTQVLLVPVNAECRNEIEDVYYQFESEAKLGQEFIDEHTIKEPYRTNRKIEYFALSPGIFTDVTTLDSTKSYLVGRLTTKNTTTPAQNGGKGCQEYPETVYKLYVPPPIDCDIDVSWENRFCGNNSRDEIVVYNYINVRTQPQNKGLSCVDVLKQRYGYYNPVNLYDTYVYDDDGYTFRDYNDCYEYLSYF
jgi:hypothetical protein